MVTVSENDEMLSEASDGRRVVPSPANDGQARDDSAEPSMEEHKEQETMDIKEHLRLLGENVSLLANLMDQMWNQLMEPRLEELQDEAGDKTSSGVSLSFVSGSVLSMIAGCILGALVVAA